MLRIFIALFFFSGSSAQANIPDDWIDVTAELGVADEFDLVPEFSNPGTRAGVSEFFRTLPARLEGWEIVPSAVNLPAEAFAAPQAMTFGKRIVRQPLRAVARFGGKIAATSGDLVRVQVKKIEKKARFIAFATVGAAVVVPLVTSVICLGIHFWYFGDRKAGRHLAESEGAAATSS